MRAQSCSGKSGLASGMTGADDDDVEAILHSLLILFANTEASENVRQQILRRAPAGNFFEGAASSLKIGEKKFLRQRIAALENSLSRAQERIAGRLDQKDVAKVCDRRLITARLDVERLRQLAAQRVKACAGLCRHGQESTMHLLAHIALV